MNDIIRSFVAIELPVEIKNHIESYIVELSKFAPKLKWVKKESLHITLKFLGNQSSQIIENVIASLLSLGQNCQSFKISIKNIIIYFL